MDLGYIEVDEEVQKNTRDALQTFRDLGCTVEEVDVGWNLSTLDAWTVIWEGLLSGPRWSPTIRAGSTKSRASCATSWNGARGTASRHFYRTNKVRGDMYRSLAAIFETHDILVCPTNAIPALQADQDLSDTSLRINGKPVTTSNHPGDLYVQWQLNYPFNLMSECPVASVPSGFASNGVPTGIQLVGRTYDDVSVFRAAADYERARPWRTAARRSDPGG